MKGLEVYLTEVEETLEELKGKHLLRFPFHVSFFSASLLLNLWRVKLDEGNLLSALYAQLSSPSESVANWAASQTALSFDVESYH